MVSQAVVLSGLTRLKNEFQSKNDALSYNTKDVYTVDILSWRNFRLPKGSRIPRPPATWLKEAVSIWNPLENLSRRSLLRLWQTADFHDATHIVHRCFTYLRDSSLNSGQFDQSWKRIKAVCVWFPTSTFKLKVELNGSRYALFADGIAVWDPVPNSTHLPRHKFRWGRLDWPHQEKSVRNFAQM